MVATELTVPFNVSDGQLVTAGVAVNNIDNTILTGVISRLEGSYHFTLYALKFDGLTYTSVHTLTTLTDVTPIMGSQVTASQLSFTILDPSENTQGVCRVYNFVGLDPAVLIATLHGGYVPRTDSEFGLSDHDVQSQLTQVTINDTGRILFCVTTDRSNPFGRSVILFSRLDENTPFWTIENKGIFAQRAILPEDVAADIHISQRGSYFAVSYPTSKDSPIF